MNQVSPSIRADPAKGGGRGALTPLRSSAAGLRGPGTSGAPDAFQMWSGPLPHATWPCCPSADRLGARVRHLPYQKQNPARPAGSFRPCSGSKTELGWNDSARGFFPRPPRLPGVSRLLRPLPSLLGEGGGRAGPNIPTSWQPHPGHAPKTRPEHALYPHPELPRPWRPRGSSFPGKGPCRLRLCRLAVPCGGCEGLLCVSTLFCLCLGVPCFSHRF